MARSQPHLAFTENSAIVVLLRVFRLNICNTGFLRSSPLLHKAWRFRLFLPGFFLAAFLGPVLFLPACKDAGKAEEDREIPVEEIEPVEVDLPDIIARGRLTALTPYSSTSYFLYRGQVMGYEYELLERLADHLGLELEMKVVDDMDQIIAMLLRGEGDIISHGLTVTRQRQRVVHFTDYHTTTHQVLVQRKPEDWREMKLHEIEEVLIRDPIELIGKKVHVRRNSSYYRRLENLSEEIGGDIEIVPVDGGPDTEEIIRMVAEGEIDFTVADQNIAEINAAYQPILDVETPVSFNQRIAWAVRPNSPELLEAVNAWIAKMKRSTDYYVLYNKYFKNSRAYRRRAKSEYLSFNSGKISEYDNLLKKFSERIDWDWRLLAAQVYHESQFDPEARSWAGARGLMQVMPSTAEDYGIDAPDLTDPRKNLDAGTAYLRKLQERWEDIPDPEQRTMFVLASFNVGENHVEDARRLAEKHGADPDIWTDNVDRYIKLKSNPEYYNDPVVRYGYARGSEPSQYVKDILDTYQMYRDLVPGEEQPGQAEQVAATG